jgi:hypothetical protein
MDRTIDTREQGMSDTTDLMRLTYFSRHGLACDADGFNPAFTAIEQAAVPRNGGLGVTGFLICARTWFAQVIEGPADSIEQLYAVIEGDPRHHSLQVVEHVQADRRLFPDWHMAIGHASPQAGMVFATFDFSEIEAPQGRQPGDFHDLAADLAALKRLQD